MTEAEFRWQALFQRAREPFFVLNRQRRVLFVNHAWVALTGLAAAEARGLTCLRRAVRAEDPRDLVIRSACCPPPEVLQGQAGRTRRLVLGEAGSAWWDVDFLPLHGADGLLCILGRVTPLPPGEATAKASLPQTLAALHEALAEKLGAEQRDKFWRPEKLVALRERWLDWHRLDRLASSAPAMRRVMDQVRLASQTAGSVLLVGEEGTGKEWLARAIHAHSPARERSFVALDCARLPAMELASVLFEPASGARPAHLGMFYLREPARLPREFQARLLELLPNLETDGIRLFAGCRADPEEEVFAGRLLDDLHAALGTLTLRLPPLRERRPDLPGLVEQFLRRAGGDSERAVVDLTPRAWEALRAYRWPGNLRELYAVLANARRHATGERIDLADLPAALRLAVGLEQVAGPEEERPVPLDQLLEEAERRLILLALRRAHGNKTRAAELLSIWRPRLLRRMEALGIADLTE